eukprot:9411196-Pyramimonas_sp.AAC.1
MVQLRRSHGALAAQWQAQSQRSCGAVAAQSHLSHSVVAAQLRRSRSTVAVQSQYSRSTAQRRGGIVAVRPRDIDMSHCRHM